VRVLDDAVELFRREGYEVDWRSPLEARLSRPSGPALDLRLVPEGKVFGGTYGLEVSTVQSPCSRSAGLTVRGRGVVRLQGIAFRPRRGDEAGRRLAGQLHADGELCEHLAAVHFERMRIEPDGRPVIRHMGGSLVWILFPPLLKHIPLVPEQARATIAALERFTKAGTLPRAG
jgi:hypothetical protein